MGGSASRITAWSARIGAHLLAAGMIALAAHSWPVREYIRVVAATHAGRALGGTVSIGSLQYNLFTLDVEAENVQIAWQRGVEAANVFARRVALGLSWRALIAGRVDVEYLNLPHLDTRMASQAADVNLNGIRLSLGRRNPQYVGGFDLRGPGVIQLGDANHTMTKLRGSVSVDGDTLHLRDIQATALGLQLTVDGRVDGLASSMPRTSVVGTWRGDVSELCATAVVDCGRVRDGTLHGRFTVNGHSSPPVISIEGTGEARVVGISSRIAIDGKATLAAGAGDEWDLSQVDADVAITLTRIRESGVPLSGAASLRLQHGGWTLRVPSGQFGDATWIDGEISGAAIGKDLDAWAAVPIDGNLRVQTSDAHDLLRGVRALGLAPAAPPTREWQGMGSAQVKLTGTIGQPRAVGHFETTATRADDPAPLEASGGVTIDRTAVQFDALDVTRGTSHLIGSLSYAWRRRTIRGEFTAAVSDLGALAAELGSPGWPLSGHATASARIDGSWPRPQVEAEVHAGDVEVIRPPPQGSPDGVPLSLGGVELRVTSNNRIAVEVALPDRQINAVGAIDPKGEWPFELGIAFRDLNPSPFIEASGLAPGAAAVADGEASIRGHLQRLSDLRADLALSRLEGSYQDHLVTLARPARVRLAEGRLREADVDARLGDLAIQLTRSSPTTPIEVSAEGRLPPLPPLGDERLEIAVDAEVDERIIAVHRLSGRWGDATVEGSAQLPSAFLEAWLPNVPIAGEEDAETAAARLDATLRNVPVSQLAASLSDVNLAGAAATVDVVVAARAERPALDALHVDGRVERGRLDVADMHFEQQGSTVVSFDQSTLAISESRWTAPGVDVTLRAHAPMADDVRRFEVGVAGDVDLSAAVKRVQERISGTARVDLTIKGDGETVTWNGGVKVREGAWIARGQGLALADVEAALACASAECHIESFAGRLNGGTVTLRGAVPMPGAQSAASLDASVRGAGFEMPKGTRHDVDADLTLAGGDKPRVTGTVTVWPAAISESLTGLTGLVSSFRSETPADAKPSQLSEMLSAVSLDIGIDAGESLVLDSPDVEAAATANLRVRGTLSSPRLAGEVATLEAGRIYVAGREWRLEQATVTLQDAAGGANVQLAATLTARIAKYAVSISLSGPASRPALVMSADPPLSQSDLAELVLTGTTTSSDVGRSSAQRVATLVSTDLLTNVGRSVGIDAIRIEQSTSELSTADLEPVSRLTISKRLTDRFEVVYSQGLGEEDDLAWVLVWKPGRHALDVRATVRTSGSEAFELRQEIEFGAPPRRTRDVVARPVSRRVSRIDITGLPADETAEVRALLSLEAGEAFTSAAWQLDRETIVRHFQSRDRLRARVRATQARAADDSYILTYHVVPGPITQIDVRGYEIDDEIRQALRDAWSNALSEELVTESLTDQMRLALAAAGYLEAQVATQLAAPQDGAQLAAVEVLPGTRARRRSIVFTGHRAVAERDLHRSVSAAHLEPDCWLDPAMLNRPVQALYRTRGFLAARVDTTRDIADGRATLQVRIDEGPAFTVGTVTFAGVAALGEEAARAALALADGSSFSDAALSSAASRLRVAYARAGHLEAEVETTQSAQSDRHVVDVHVSVKEGATSVLRGIQVNGGSATSPNLVSRAFQTPLGQPVDRMALDRGQQRLYETGIFRTVGIDVHPAEGVSSPPGQWVDAVVTLEERAKWRLRYGVQFGPTTLESLAPENNTAAPGATLDIQRRNLYGVGLVVGAGGVWSGDQHRVRATASAPTFAGRPLTTTLTVEHANQDRESDEYQLNIVDRSLKSVFEQRWKSIAKRRIELAYGFETDWRRLELQATTEAPLPLRARYAALTGSVIYDTRDNAFNPHRGMLHTSRLEGGAGWWLSEIAFTRYQFQQFVYYPVRRLTFASGLRFGTLDVDNEQDPTSLLLYFRTGGGNSVRGYDDDALTPGYVLGVPAGGKVLLVMNQEVRIPIWRRIGGVVFLDAGNTFLGLDEVTLNGLKVGTGAGVRFDTPVAVLRFDVGFPVPRLTGQPRARWYLSLGQAF